MNAVSSIIERPTSYIDKLGNIHRMLPWVVAYVLLLPLPLVLETVLNEYYVYLANRICIFILLCVGLNIV